MRGLYNFIWMGGFYVVIICSLVGFFHWGHSEEGAIMVMAFAGMIPSTLSYFIFPIKGMLKKELPGDTTGLEHIVEEKKQEYKNHLIIPFVAWVGFIFLFYAIHNEEVNETPLLKAVFVILAVVAFFRALTLVFKIPMKKKIQIIVDSRRKTQGL